MPTHDGDEAIGSDRRAFFKSGGRRLAEDAKEQRRKFLVEQSERDRASRIEQLRKQALETTLGGRKDEEEVNVEEDEVVEEGSSLSVEMENEVDLPKKKKALGWGHNLWGLVLTSEVWGNHQAC